jgi:hypothetical protein
MKNPVDSAVRYEWSDPGDNGVIKSIAIDKLYVDQSYQRGEVSNKNTLAIARSFSWEAFGTIVVMQRSDGEYLVVDGHQRLLAARKRGDIKRVPCIVFQSRGVVSEAKAFLSVNTRRKTVLATTKFWAAVACGGEPETSIAEWVKTIGYRIVNKHYDSKPKVIKFCARLVDSWQRSAESAKRAIMMIKTLDQNRPPSVHVFMGFFDLIRNGICLEEYADKIESLGGQTKILFTINKMAIEAGTSKSERLCGSAVLSLVNHGKKTKISRKPDTGEG